MAEFEQWRETKRTPLRDVAPLDTPYNILIETSSLCNARCIYCAHSQKEDPVYKGNMSSEIYEKILQDVREFPHRIKLFEMFAYGEPLCNPMLADMISRAKKAGVVDKIAFTTNGLLFNRDNIDAILESGVDIIRISLQGLDEETYYKICGVKMNMKKFLSTLSYLYDRKKMRGGGCSIRVKIADTALRDVQNGKEKLMDMFGAIADSVYIEHIIPMFSDVAYDEIDPDIAGNTLNGRENVKQTSVNLVCHRPFYRLRVAANGLVTAACCDTPHDFVYGNILENSLKELWYGKRHEALLKMLLNGKRFQHPICGKCVLPNDITNENDLMDEKAEEVLERLNRKEFHF